MRETNNRLKHVDGFYNLREMTEISGKSSASIHSHILRNCPFKFGHIGGRIYAIKESFDKWVSEGCPNVHWHNVRAAKDRLYEDTLYKKKCCALYFRKCGHKVPGKRFKTVCPFDCEHYEKRYREPFRVYSSYFELPKDPKKIREFLALEQLKNETE